MKLFVSLFLITNLGFIFSKEVVRYDNCQVVKVIPNNEGDLQYLENLENIEGYQFWTDIKTTGYPVDILVQPNLRSTFLSTLKSRNMNYEIMISNVQDLIDTEKAQMALARKESRAAGDWTTYWTLDEVNEWLDTVAAENPNVVALVNGGSSYQGRTIRGLRLSWSPDNNNNVVFLDGNIHAREWITGATVTFIINELLTSSDATIRRIAESRDWVIFPVINPDGYVYTYTTDRLWRKTLTPHGACDGVDPNRNWDYHYNEGGASSNPCSETYNGPNAFSEPSTRSLSEFILGLGSDIQAYFSLHSYSQYLLLPYGYTSDHLDNYDELREVGLRGLESLTDRYGTQYEIGNVPELLYIASGSSMDWVKGTLNPRIAYTYELRDTGRYGFVLPADQIIPTAQETLDSVIRILDEFDNRL